MTTQGAGFVKANRQGNQIYPAGSGNTGGSNVAELSSHEDIQERDLNPDEDLVVEELEGGNARIRERREDERVIKVDLQSDRIQKFYSDDEIEELESKQRTLTGDSEPEKDIDEVWENIREGVRKHNKEVAKNKKELEKERIREAYRDPAMDRKVRDMTGEMLQRVMSDDDSSHVDEAELQSALAEVEKKYQGILGDSEPEIEDPSTEIEELEEGTQAWKEIGGYWEELANDVEASSELPNTEITTLQDGKKLVKTSYDELKAELRQVDNNPDKEGEIVDKQGEVITARVSEGDKF